MFSIEKDQSFLRENSGLCNSANGNAHCLVKGRGLWYSYGRIIETLFPGVERHGVFEAMHDFNLEVKKGEVLGVLGKNGAGKSTLLKMITGVVTPTKGTIEAKGKISSLLELGTAFNQELTGYENIYQHGQVMGLTNEEIKAREQEIIDFADIGDHLYLHEGLTVKDAMNELVRQRHPDRDASEAGGSAGAAEP